MEVFTSPVVFCIVRDFYTKDEIELLSNELVKLKPHFGGPEKTGTAHDILGNVKKENKGIFLDIAHPIVKLNRKVLRPEFVHELIKEHWFFKYIKHCNKDSTLVSYYEDSDHYKEHEDSCIVTAIHYHWKEPKMFSGGDIYFGDFKVPISNNCLLIFPSCTEHSVTAMQGSGRYATTQFISQVDEIPHQPVNRFMNFMTINEYNKVKCIVENEQWTAKGSSGPSAHNNIKFLYMDLSKYDLFTSYFLGKIRNLTGKNFILDRVYANGQWYGSDGSWHQDSAVPNTWTFLYYMNDIDEGDLDAYGGCTEFREDDITIKGFKPLSNSAIIFNSNLFHRGMSPSRFCADMRVTIAWKLTEIIIK
jgi:Rps23 Pro-64 3,4-dihydroxylase Tpa1-like proline 4-hydroxylase